jgi:hypothetical protein
MLIFISPTANKSNQIDAGQLYLLILLGLGIIASGEVHTREFEFGRVSCVVGKKSCVVRIKSRGSKNALNFHFFAQTLFLLK